MQAIPVEPASAPASFEEAYHDYASCTARWARDLGGTEVEVEDVVQEVFLVVSRRLRDFRGDARFSSWLFGITRKIVANHRRRHRWRFWASSNDRTVPVPVFSCDPVAELEQRRKVELFYRALDCLPEKYRTVLVLYEMEGMSTQGIADFCDLKLTTVRVQLVRARERFLGHYQDLINKGKR
jgi:RNA polymerase sigma-70 factor, ECF subfamily